MRKIFMLLVCAIVMVAFVGIGICADTNRSKENKMGMMDKMKKVYSDFRNRDKVKKAQTASPSIAKKVPVKPKKMPPAPIEKEFTKEEMIADIKDDLETYDEIPGSIPGIKAEKDKEGRVSYTCNGVKIEDMSKEDLQPLFKKVRQFAIKLNTERIQHQLEIGRAQTTADVARGGVATPPRPPAPPQIPKVSSVPSTPPSPSSPSSLSSPPSAPRTSPSLPSAPQRR